VGGLMKRYCGRDSGGGMSLSWLAGELLNGDWMRAPPLQSRGLEVEVQADQVV
jgi:hypothetical protein